MRLLRLSGIVAVVLFCGITWYLAPLEPGALALRLAFTPRAFGAIIHVWSEAQLTRYRAHLPFDFALIIAYAIFGYRLVMYGSVFARSGRRMTRLAAYCLPWAALCAVLVNLFHCWLTAAPRFDMPWIYAVSAAGSLLSGLFMMAFIVLVLWALAGDVMASTRDHA